MNYRGPGAPLRPSPLAKSKPSYRRVQGSARLEPTVSRAEAQRGVTLTQRDVSDLSDRDSRVGFIRKVRLSPTSPLSTRVYVSVTIGTQWLQRLKHLRARSTEFWAPSSP